MSTKFESLGLSAWITRQVAKLGNSKQSFIIIFKLKLNIYLNYRFEITNNYPRKMYT